MISKLYILIVVVTVHASAGQITRVDPPNWWTDMNYDTLSLMLYGSDFTGLQIHSDSPVIEIISVRQSPNTRYAFVNIHIADSAKPGNYLFQVKTSSLKPEKIGFELKKRKNAEGRFRGFDCNDIIYLITPDRFANGDPGNDFNPDMIKEYAGENEQLLRRSGGDLNGIMARLDYIKDLGFSAVWINPLIENNMPISYHGYAATDFYRIDPRFGTNQDYISLIEQAHNKGLKIIMDHVVNHIGIYHPWMDSLPDSAWINGSVQEHDNNWHKKEALFDPYADSLQISNVKNAWFDDIMPDLNQKNGLLAKYLIQNTHWWIESSGIDGIREDTYPYADAEFLSHWAQVILNEYPDFNIVGEVWIHDPVYLAPFQANNTLDLKLATNLPSVTDFGLFEAFGRVFNRNANISEIHSMLGKDFLYGDPAKLVTFTDNHDVMRLADLVGGNMQRYIMALKLLLTIRGIPQIYYGTEIGLAGGADHGEIRRNFPGGFPGDSRNAFLKSGRTEEENYIFDQLRSIIGIRKEYPALSCGETLHFPAQDNFYVYLRQHAGNKMLMVANNEDDERYCDLSAYYHHLHNHTTLYNVETGHRYTITDKLQLPVPANDVIILQVR